MIRNFSEFVLKLATKAGSRGISFDDLDSAVLEQGLNASFARRVMNSALDMLEDQGRAWVDCRGGNFFLMPGPRPKCVLDPHRLGPTYATEILRARHQFDALMEDAFSGGSFAPSPYQIELVARMYLAAIDPTMNVDADVVPLPDNPVPKGKVDMSDVAAPITAQIALRRRAVRLQQAVAEAAERLANETP